MITAEATDISAATRITLKIGGILIDSNTASASAFDWTTYGADGRLDLKLGHEKQIINLRKGPYRALIKIYDATYTNGLPWDELMMEVKDA